MGTSAVSVVTGRSGGNYSGNGGDIVKTLENGLLKDKK